MAKENICNDKPILVGGTRKINKKNKMVGE